MKGELKLPGDKSISHRIAMVAALANGPCSIQNFNTGEDCASTLRCLEQLGVRIKGNLELHPPSTLKRPTQILDCGNSGSTIRFLQGLLAGQNIAATLTGDESLRRRPMKRVAEPLRKMGAVIHLTQDDFAPVRIEEGVKHPIEYRMPVSSAQVKTALLFAGLKFPETRVIEPIPSRDHTERLLQYLKPRGDQFSAFQYVVPGDPSAAAFFVISALLKKNFQLNIPNLLVNPSRIAYIRILQRSGARIQIQNERLLQNEPVADVEVESTSAQLSPIEITPEEVPSVIDEIPALSILGTRFGFQVRGASELRKKESDRIHAMVSNLKSLGIDTEEFQDGYKVEPGNFKRGVAKTYGDHRIAMAFGAAGIEIDDDRCVNISLPEFFPLLEKLNS